MDHQQESLVSFHKRPSVLTTLRTETRAVHQRLHHHAALAALQAGRIARGDYIALLGRLYGFYKPLGSLIGSIGERVQWLEQDLAALGSDAFGIPRQAALAVRLDSPAARLGAEYVSEGSALGGRLLADGARRVLGPDPVQGYRFFHGHGAETARHWKRFIWRLEEAEANGLDVSATVAGACLTFQAFEDWMT